MMLILITGKVDPNSVRFSGDWGSFILQAGRHDCFRVKVFGLEQSKLIKTVRAGETVFLAGTAENRNRMTIIPHILIKLNDGNHEQILQIARQIMETQLDSNF
jgi:hypothetical protein